MHQLQGPGDVEPPLETQHSINVRYYGSRNNSLNVLVIETVKYFSVKLKIHVHVAIAKSTIHISIS